MTRRTLWALLAAAGLLVVVLGVFGAPLFLPEKAQHVNEPAPAADDLVVLKQGTFHGAGDGVHDVSGTVRLVRLNSTYLLHFQDYRQTQGPDVFVYLTTEPDARSRGDVESGLRVRIDGGADNGESTKVGSFTQTLPAGTDPAPYHGVAIWCDRFNEYFGGAPLAAP